MFNRTIKQIHLDLKSKRVTALEIIRECNKNAQRFKYLNHIVKFNPQSLQDAEVSDGYFSIGKPRSMLEGIPMSIKDNFCTKDLETTCGSKMLKKLKPKYSATVVDKLLSNGGIIVGKTNLDEFAMGSGTIDSVHGPSKNIWMYSEKDWHITGGSSGGSAVAVASGASLGALGSDTGGSTRNPASYCGVVGLKPTYGLLSRHGLIPLVNSMDVPGILARNVEDACLIFDYLSGHDIKDSTTLPGPRKPISLLGAETVKSVKVGIPREYNIEDLADEVRAVWQEVTQLLSENGAIVQSMSLPHTEHSIVCYSVLNQCEVASNMARYDGLEFGHRSQCMESTAQMYALTRSEGFNNVVRSRILAGNYFLLQRNYDKYFSKALKVRRLISEDFKSAWREGYHVLLTPTTLTDAPKYNEFVSKDHREQCATQDFCTQPANMTGCPAVTIPVKLSRKGLPLSIQLMAPNMEEETMMNVAKFIENAVQFDSLRCQVFTQETAS